MTIRRLLFLFVLAALLSTSVCGRAQIPGLTTSQTTAASQQPAVPADPLGREDPRGCLLGPIKAMQEEKHVMAVQYFQPSRPANSCCSVSRDPQGRLDDGLPANEERISSSLGTDTFPILLVRLEDERGRKLWYISRTTLESVPKVYDSLRSPELEKRSRRTWWNTDF
jgi:MscS family membrane protein